MPLLIRYVRRPIDKKAGKLRDREGRRTPPPMRL